MLRELEKRGNARDIALVRLLMSCGPRVGEAVSLKISDLDLGERQGTVTIRYGKGGKWRAVPVPNAARRAIREWLTDRVIRFPKNNPWLFPNRTGGHITVRRAEAIIKELGRFAGIEIRPHVLRHTAARNLFESGADLVTVAIILGHESFNTTAIYTRPGLADLQKAIENSEM